MIAIDGYSACGKSTTARAVANKLGYTYVDSGAMYRAVTWYLLQNGVDIGQQDVRKWLDEINITFRSNIDGKPVTYLNDEDVEEKIRAMDVSEHVSAVAALSVVRRAMVRQQQAMGKEKGIVMDGRDIGTVVFPKAELKIFMTARPDIRAARRLEELEQKGIESSLEEVVTNLQERDRIDTTRSDSPLRKAADAIELDNSNLSFEEQVEKVIALATKKIGT